MSGRVHAVRGETADDDPPPARTSLCGRSPGRTAIQGSSADPAIPLSLYLHFPWCVQKCPYCDFNSHALRGNLPEDAYIDALLRDLDWELTSHVSRLTSHETLISIFMGGGTPSLFSDRSIGRLLEEVNRRLAFVDGIEITLEANPGTAEAGHFRGYRAAGVNRLSMGVQSLEDAQLKRLGRIHSAAEAVAAYGLARAAGFDDVNLDLMYALPQQNVEGALSDLDRLIALQPEHLSWYQLTLEPNTAFGVNPPPVPDDDASWAMQQAGQQRLAAAGYAQYEVSAYARGGRQSRHNRNYWEYGDYLGIGAGAHSKRTDAGGIGAGAHSKRTDAGGIGAGAHSKRTDAGGIGAGAHSKRTDAGGIGAGAHSKRTDAGGIGAGAHGKRTSAAPFGITRRARHKHPRGYQQHAGTAAAIQEQQAVAADERPFEFMMNALRLNEGFAPARYAARTGLPWDPAAPAVRRAQQSGLLEVGADRVRATEQGRRYLNGLLRLFLET